MATRDPEGTRGKRADRLIRDAQRSKVVAVLQHPHSTDTPAIWAAGWSGVRLKLRPDTYASGIAYNNRGSSVRAPLNEVLTRTRIGNVIDYVWTAGSTVRRTNRE